MRQSFLIILILLFCMNTWGQKEGVGRDFSEIPENILIHLDKMGIDTLSYLNKWESQYLNTIFSCPYNEFDFTGKKVAFLFNRRKSSKNEYFKKEQDRFALKQTTTAGLLYVFDEVQKEEVDSYDAVIKE